MGPRIAVMGSGGIGGSIGAYLLHAGHDVTLIDQWAAHIEVIRRDGLTFTDVNQEFTVPAEALHLSDVSSIQEPFDVVFLSVKSYDTVWSTHLIKPYLKPGGFVLPAMNALNDETVARIVGYGRVVGCVTTISSGAYDPGHIVRTAPTTLHAFSIGELSGVVTPRVRWVAEALSVIGPSEATTNIWGARWSKMVWNSMGNALAGLVGPDTDRLTKGENDLTGLVRVAIGCEAVRVAKGMGIVLDAIQGIPSEEWVEASGRGDIEELRVKLDKVRARRNLTAEQAARIRVPARPSLLQDVIKHRRTETAYLNGEIARMGGELGVATPMNEAMVAIMAQLDSGQIEPGPTHLKVLERILPGE